MVMIFKSVVMVTLPTFFVLICIFFLGEISFSHLIYSYVCVLFFTMLVVRPFIINIYSLTDYVNDLASDRQVEEPRLERLKSISQLPQAFINMRNSWEKKKKQTASLITEYETLVDSLPDILLMCNNELKIVRTNKAARALFGQNLATKLLATIVPNDDLLNAIAVVMEDHVGRTMEFQLDREGVIDFKAIIELFPAASGDNIAVIITLNDITKLRQVGKMQADFVANASHEIRTPLTSIIGYVETLLGPAKDDIAVHGEFLQIIGEQATRMKKLIGDLLSLSKIEMSEHAAPGSKVDMLQIIRNVKESYAWAVKEKNMTIRLELQDALPFAKGEESELMQVIHNLIGNAIKYGNAGTEVLVTARVTSIMPEDPNLVKIQRAICISVIDHGDGVAREDIPRLTERFYRVDSARSKAGGTGLGLAIVKHIIHRHRGVLSIESVVGEGSTFSIYLHIYVS